jgi:hypothetical protein
MHMLIRVVSEAYDAEDATGIAHGLFEGVDAPLYYLYNEYGTAIRSQAEFDQLLDEIATDDTGNDETSFYLTPVDVHY